MKPTFSSMLFKDDGSFPNHPYLPALLYSDCIDQSLEECKKLFAQNRWANHWVGGIFDYHHYHSKTHESLAVLEGRATLSLGGPHGQMVEVEKGDLLILPAGVGHKNEKATEDFQVLGAYPFGHSFDLKTGEEYEYKQALKEIPEAPQPASDPLLGKKGPLMELWM